MTERTVLRQRSRIGVAIPYFERDAGLLHRALGSMAAQDRRPVQLREAVRGLTASCRRTAARGVGAGLLL